MPKINEILSRIDDLRECVRSGVSSPSENLSKVNCIGELIWKAEISLSRGTSTFPANEPVARIHVKSADLCEVEVLNKEKLQTEGSPVDVYCEPAGHVVVTRDPMTRQILAVTRQDDEGRIISVIAEAPSSPKPIATLQKTQDGETRIAFRNQIIDTDSRWGAFTKNLFTVKQVAVAQAGINQTGVAHLWNVCQEGDLVSAVQWEVTPDGVIARGEARCIKARTLEELRTILPGGLVNIGKSCSDAPITEENWLEI